MGKVNRRLRTAGAVASAALLGVSVLGCSKSDPETTSGAATDVAAGEKISDVEGVLHFPSNDALQNLRDGSLNGAALGLDFNLIAWMAMDAAARTIVGDPPTAAEEADNMPKRLLEQNDLDVDPANGYVAYPEYQERIQDLSTHDRIALALLAVPVLP